MISSARSVSTAGCPPPPAPRSADLVGGDRLDLHELATRVRERRATIEHACRAVVRPSAPGRRRRTGPRAPSSCCRARASARSLIAAPAARSSSQSGSSPTTRARLSRMVVVARPGWRAAGSRPASVARRREASPAARPRSRPGSEVHGAHAGAPARQPAADVHQAGGVDRAQTSAPVSSTERSLSDSIAVDTSAFFTANVPPKPQHSSASGQLHQVEPAHGRSTAAGARRRAGRAASGRSGGRSRGAGSTRPRPRAEHVHEELGQLVHRRRLRRAARAPSRRRTPMGTPTAS